MYDPMKPHCLDCPYKPPLEREKVARQLFVEEGKEGRRYMVNWLGSERIVREMSKEEFEDLMRDMLRPDPPPPYRRFNEWEGMFT